MKRYLIMLGLVLVLLGWLSQIALAQGPVTPPPVTPVPTVNPIDAANARADQWQTVANQAVSSAQASINYAYGALANAQAGLNQALIALQAEQTARISAQQGQIQQAVDAAHSAQLSAVSAIALVSESSAASMRSIEAAGEALRGSAELRTSLTAVTAQRDAIAGQRDAAIATAGQYDKDRTALAGQLVAERQRSDLYSKVALGALLLLAVMIVYYAVVLWKLVKALRIRGTDRMVVLDQRGRVTAEIEALH